MTSQIQDGGRLLICKQISTEKDPIMNKCGIGY